VNGLRAYLIPVSDCRRERLHELIAAGATAICLPIVKTRTGLQTSADEAQGLGLAVYGWIELGADSGIQNLRRLLEAYPHLDGYFVGHPNGQWLDAAMGELAAFRIQPAPSLRADPILHAMELIL
jgi:hypothetical protein